MPRADRIRQRVAQLRANGRTEEAARLARQAAREGGRDVARLSSAAVRAARERVSRDGRRRDPVDASLDAIDPDEGASIQEIGARAERASRARAPVDADLSLTGNPRAIESFAASGMAVDAGGVTDAGGGGGGQQPQRNPEERATAALNPGFVTSVGVDAGGMDSVPDDSADSDGDGGALQFDDPFGVGGGGRW